MLQAVTYEINTLFFHLNHCLSLSINVNHMTSLISLKKYTLISLEMTCYISINVLLFWLVRWRFHQIQGVLSKLSNQKKKLCLDTLYKGFNKNCVCLFSGKAKVLSKKKRNRFLPTTSSAKYGCCLNIQKVHSMRES